MSVSSGVWKGLIIAGAVLAAIWLIGALTANASEPPICVLKGTVLNAAGERIQEVSIRAICDTNFIKIENHAAWLLKHNYAQTDKSGQWRLPLIAGLTYTLIFVDNWRGRQKYVEEHYYIPFCDSVYFGESDCIEETR